MKRFSWVATILLVTSVILGFVGCKEPPIEPTVDKTPPAEVTSFYVTIEKGSASLSWVNPSDTDFAGVQISMIPAEGIFVNPISLGKDATSFTVPGLEVDCTYRFTIKTFDNNQNYSNGVTQKITIESNNLSQGDDSSGYSGNDNPSGGGPSGSTDTTAPAQVTNLSAVYDAQTLQITISWTNPQDEDFAETEVVYGKLGLTEKTTLTFDKSYSSTVIQGIAADDSEYVVSVKTKDTTGNLSQVTSITVIAVNDEIVVPEGLRTGDYVLTDNTYVRKEYYSELTQEERAKIFGIVLITDSGEPLILGTQFYTNESRWTASPVGIDTYLADIATSVYVDETYTFTGDLDGADNWEYICSVDPTNTQGTQVASMYPAFCLANIYATYAGLTGTDFADGWYVPTISELYQMYKNISTIKSSLTKLGISLPYTYDDNLDEYTCRDFWSSSVPTAFGTTAYELDYHTGEITNVDRGTNSNYVWVFHKFNNKFNCYEYPEAQITNVELDTTGVGESYTGTIPVTITGKNLLAYEITSPDSNISNINYVSNTEATAELNIDNSVGSHLVTINCGTASGSTVYNVIEAEKCFAVGDILFTDGTRVKVENVQYGIPDGQISKAFGVIVSTSYDGAVGKAVGLQRGTNLMWAPGGTTGLNTNFTEIQGDTTSGDMDGSDNWDYICSVDPTGSADAATNYPAFNFANTYGQTAGLTGTDYEDGWYLPAIVELKSVYDNRHIVAESLSAVGGAETLGSYCYCWSSCQYASSSNFAYELNFGSLNFGGVSVYDYYNKNGDCTVLVLRAFNAQ